ncbi:tRNA (adenosine(37)-N6)-dimethylallyltransferase MiaA [Erythrobacter sp. YT30]|uniref:tRNA (adenosine(37)-N6)-dimethylallyltransferase MiaA n=1 Tax=Erythrobacter sp. YT30 TaxID=1735012 RepID=UPI00076D275C|nr:tRNA (adenosine(37)-N6)-dimethylallyltransferase MiaA [Erythrobacter sp. YT30]KWV92852.1 tRNA dimethylallyltransferase [Erythrobacter sp. YT30]
MSTVEDPHSKPVALIAGPTASGKSAMAVDLAKALKKAGQTAVIINADSAQVYSDLAVLSARPTEKEMGGIEHRLFGEWDGAQACSAADWAKRARQEIAACHEAGGVPILVGGTGLYFKVLLEGIAPIPEIDPKVRAATRELSTEAAFAALQIEDPERAADLNPTDSQRIARALEVKRSTGVTLGDWQLSKSGGIGEEVTLFPAVLMPEREWVYRRCDARFAEMAENGALEEVKALLARDLDLNLPVMRAIGVPELSEHLADNLPLTDAIANAQQSTRNYAKRQFTWFRNQFVPDWPRVTIDEGNKKTDLNAIFAGLFQK